MRLHDRGWILSAGRCANSVPTAAQVFRPRWQHGIREGVLDSTRREPHMHRALALVLLGLLAVAGAFVAPAARGASPDVLVSQVFAGGGNAGAPYSNDFVELFNRGSSAVDVSGWSVQYASATGTSWQVTALTGSIAPGRHYLVQLASGGTVGAGLPTPDATGTSNLAVSGGKVAVVRSATALTCGATAGSCSAV